MTYDEMETRIAKARDGLDAAEALFAEFDETLHEAMTDDTQAAFTLMCESMGMVLEGLSGIYQSNEELGYIAEIMTHKGRAKLVFQLLGVAFPDGPDASPDKHFAVDFADVIGPDWAQAFYRLAVLTTKVA